MNDCVFCKIVKGEIPSKKVYEDESVIAFENIYPAADTHLLICPKEHVETLMDIKKDFDLFSMVNAAQQIINEKNLGQGYKLVFNGGKYQSIKHLHWHLLAGNLENEDDILNKT